MELKLIISDRRFELLSVWREVFVDIEEVRFLEMDSYSSIRLPEADAVLMMGMFAHERYGGKPIVGESQILSTKGALDMRPWVVTTVPLAAHFGTVTDPNGSKRFGIVPDQRMAPDQELYIQFSTVFERIKKFNKGPEEPKIRTLVFDLEFLNIPRGEPRKEAEAVRRAYIEHCGPD